MSTPRSPGVAGRLGAVLCVVSGLVTLLSVFEPAPPDINRLGVFLVGVVAVVSGAVVWAIPWGRLPSRAQWGLMLLAHGLIALHNQFGGDPFRYGLFFLVSFAWVGMTQGRWTSVVFLPSFLVAYLTPLLLAHAPGWQISSVLYAAPVCVLVAETLSWTGERLVEAQGAVARGEERFHSLVQNSTDVVIVLDARGVMSYVSPSIEEVLGWRPEELIGLPGRTLVYAVDRENADTEERKLTLEPGVVRQWEVRAARRMGGYRWVQLRMANLLDDPSVCGFVCNFSDITERREMTERLRYYAYHDPLTGLPNRVAFLEQLEQAVARAARHGSALAVLFIDLDDFKQVNDSFGHAAGDSLLHSVAGLLRSCTRPEDTLARLSGDEFTVLVEDVAPDQARLVAERLLERITAPFNVAGNRIEVACSIGIAEGRAGLDTPQEMLRRADAAMYQAKSVGRNQFAVFAADGTAFGVELAGG